MFKIALDAGHGKYTPGKRCLKSFDRNETREWFLNDRICDRIEKLLKAYNGYEILRVDDTMGESDIPLANRTASANRWGADFYLSVHHNAGVGGGTGGGPVTIVYTSASETSLRYQEIVHECFIARVGKFGNRADSTPMQNLHVLRETNMPAVLIECGFMDSSVDVPKILSEDFADKAARGLVDALVKIGGLTKKDTKENAMEPKFEDIKGHYAEQQIKDLFRVGIVNGVDETHFAPNEPIKRSDVAIIARNVIRYITGK